MPLYCTSKLGALVWGNDCWVKISLGEADRDRRGSGKSPSAEDKSAKSSLALQLSVNALG